MNLKDTYNRIAEDWVTDHNSDMWWGDGMNYLLSLLPKGASILDVGCGAGVKTKFLGERGHRVVGIDFSEKMIEIAKRTNPGIEFRVLDMYDINTLSEKFDCIFAQASLLHIPKARVMEVLTKFKNQLNEGGLLYISVKRIRDNGVEEEIKKEADYGYEYDRFFSYFSQNELESYCTDLGLEIIWRDDRGSEETIWIQLIVKNNTHS